MTLQEHKMSWHVCCYWSVTDDLVFFLLPVMLWIPMSKVVEVEKHQMLTPTNTTIVLRGWRQSTAVKWCVKTVWFASRIQFLTKCRRQDLYLRINAANRSWKDSCMRKSKELFDSPFSLLHAVWRNDSVSKCYIQTVQCSTVTLRHTATYASILGDDFVSAVAGATEVNWWQTGREGQKQNVCLSAITSIWFRAL